MGRVRDETRLAVSFISFSQLLDLGGDSLYCFYWFCICLFPIIIKRKKLGEIKEFYVGCVI